MFSSMIAYVHPIHKTPVAQTLFLPFFLTFCSFFLFYQQYASTGERKMKAIKSKEQIYHLKPNVPCTKKRESTPSSPTIVKEDSPNHQMMQLPYDTSLLK